jgi:hypothetical protein
MMKLSPMPSSARPASRTSTDIMGRARKLSERK